MDARCAGAKCCFIFPGFGAADPRVGRDFVEPHFDEPGSRGTDGVVITVSVFAGHDEFIWKTVAARQPFHPPDVPARQDGGRAQRQRRGCSSGHQSGLRSGRRGDPHRGGRLQLL